MTDPGHDLVDANIFAGLRKSLLAKGSLHLRVVTGSMAPVVLVGDMIHVVPLNGDPNPFDILVFWNGKRLICHYVLLVNKIPSSSGETFVVTCALDGSEDLPVEMSRVLGLVANPTIDFYLRLKISLRRWLKMKLRRGFFAR